MSYFSSDPRRRRAGAKGLPVLFALVLLSALVVSCGGTDDEGAATASGTDARAGAGEATEATDELIIYSYDAFPEAIETVITEHFQEDFGVVPTLERFQDTGGLYNEVWLEREDPRADVVIGLDNTYVGRALDAGLFQAYRPERSDALRDSIVVDPEFRLTPFDWGHVVLNYDSERLPSPPTTWEGLTDPRLRESIILMNPATSSPGRNFLLFTIAVHGEEGYLDYWERLKPNILTITAGWSDGYGLYSQGEAPIVLSYETSPAYHIAYEDTDRYRNLILDDQGYAQIEVAGITTGARNLVNARRLMDLLLTDELQAELPLNQFMYPVFDSVSLPDAFEQVERAQETVFIPVDRVDANYERWLTDWQEVMR